MEDLEGIYKPFESIRISNEDSDRSKDEMFPLRVFLNWSQSHWMNTIVKRRGRGIVALDYGCGEGGNCKKWFHVFARKVYYLEEDKTQLQECKDRVRRLSKTWHNIYKTEFLNRRLFEKNLHLPEKVDIVCCDRKITSKIFSSKENVETIAANISGCLKKGGFLVVMLVNGNRVEKRMSQIGNRKSISQKNISITFDKPLPSVVLKFGLKYTFRRGDKSFENYHVHPDVLIRMMANAGLVVIDHNDHKSVLDLYEEGKKNPHDVRTMQKMRVLKYTPFKELKLTMPDEQLEFAKFYDVIAFKKI